MKTYPFASEPKNTQPEQPWQARWVKKFGGTYSKPVTVTKEEIEAPVIDPPPVPASDLSELLSDYAKLATSAVASAFTGDPEKAEKMLRDWLPDGAEVPLTVDARLKGFKVPARYSMAETIRTYTMKRAASKMAPIETVKRPEPGPAVVTSYLHSVYDPATLKKTVDTIVELMRPVLTDFDAIAFRGSSGAAVAYPVSYILGKPLVHIRKDTGHSHLKLEGQFGAKRIAVVDDFVCSGKTIRILWQELVDGYAQRGYSKPVLAHLFLYAECCSASEGRTRGSVGEILDGCEIHIAYDASML